LGNISRSTSTCGRYYAAVILDLVIGLSCHAKLRDTKWSFCDDVIFGVALI
jgi:hypothetical protein